MNEVSLVNTALYYRQASTMADAAEVLGRPNDAAAYGQLAKNVVAAAASNVTFRRLGFARW